MQENFTMSTNTDFDKTTTFVEEKCSHFEESVQDDLEQTIPAQPR